MKKRRGEGWIPKWEAKIVMTTVSKAHALKTNEARSLCIAGGKICGAEMARQPARVSAINTGMAKPVYRVRVELIEIREFLERYPPPFFFPPPRWSRCTYMVKPLERIGEQGTRWYVAWLRNSVFRDFKSSGRCTYMVKPPDVIPKDQLKELWNGSPAGAPKWWSRQWLVCIGQ